jgi:transcriptional regulator with XRE-family HTH domain
MMDYGRRTRELREKAGLTQAQLAEMIGFRTPYYLSQIETGKRTVGLSVLNKICRALGIDLSDFFGKEMPPVDVDFVHKAILDQLGGVSRDKLDLIREYIATVKDMTPGSINETISYAKKEKLWEETLRSKQKGKRKG